MADDSESGLTMLQSRVERGRRVVAPPRQPAAPPPAADTNPETLPAGADDPAPPTATKAAANPPPATPAVQTPRPATKPAAGLAYPGRDEPLANLAVRVRRSLDEKVNDLIHDLRRRHGIRITKAELMEVLLVELPPAADTDLVARVNAFMQAAPPRR